MCREKKVGQEGGVQEEEEERGGGVTKGSLGPTISYMKQLLSLFWSHVIKLVTQHELNGCANVI